MVRADYIKAIEKNDINKLPFQTSILEKGVVKSTSPRFDPSGEYHEAEWS